VHWPMLATTPMGATAWSRAANPKLCETRKEKTWSRSRMGPLDDVPPQVLHCVQDDNAVVRRANGAVR
jgi:hypothetical protein